MIDDTRPFCHKCKHVELQPTGPIYCTATMRTIPTRVMRLLGEECGPEGKLYEKREPEYASE